MVTEPAPGPEFVTAKFALTVFGTRLEANITVPTAPVRLSAILRLLYSLSDAVIGAMLVSAETTGRSISCRMGCAACCRQLVPITQDEARRLRDLVESLPEPRRSTIKARFEEANRRLDEAGLLDDLRRTEFLSAEQSRALGRAYFARRSPCPFLEDETCSIYSDRPLICREYLVTTPAERCANPWDNRLRGIKMPTSLWSVLARLGTPSTAQGSFHRVPLNLALEWADAHPDETAPRPAPEWIQKFFEALTGEPVPDPDLGMMRSFESPESLG
jgi:Fe-S-cluster containining protein